MPPRQCRFRAVRLSGDDAAAAAADAAALPDEAAAHAFRPRLRHYATCQPLFFCFSFEG